MMQNLLLHIGTAKCASKQLQTCLSNNKEILLKNNIYYPNINNDNNSVLHEDLYDMNLEKRISQSLHFQNYYKTIIQKYINNIKNIKCEINIISNELIINEDPRNYIEFFDTFNVKVIVVLRHFPLWHESIKKQFAREKFEFAQYPYQESFYHYNWLVENLKKWISFYGIEKFIFINFHAAINKGIQNYLLNDIIGVPLKFENKIIHKSIRVEDVYFLSQLSLLPLTNNIWNILQNTVYEISCENTVLDRYLLVDPEIYKNVDNSILEGIKFFGELLKDKNWLKECYRELSSYKFYEAKKVETRTQHIIKNKLPDNLKKEIGRVWPRFLSNNIEQDIIPNFPQSQECQELLFFWKKEYILNCSER